MEYWTQIATAASAGCLAASFNAMGSRLLAQRLPALLPNKNQAAHVHTRSQDASFVLQCVRNHDTGQRNSAPPTAPLDNQLNDPVVYLHFGDLAHAVPTGVASSQQSATVVHPHCDA